MSGRDTVGDRSGTTAQSVGVSRSRLTADVSVLADLAARHMILAFDRGVILVRRHDMVFDRELIVAAHTTTGVFADFTSNALAASAGRTAVAFLHARRAAETVIVHALVVRNWTWRQLMIAETRLLILIALIVRVGRSVILFSVFILRHKQSAGLALQKRNVSLTQAAACLLARATATRAEAKLFIFSDL